MIKTRFILIIWCLSCFSSCGGSSRQAAAVNIAATPAPTLNEANFADINNSSSYFRLDSSSIYSPETLEKSAVANQPFEIQPPEFKQVDFSNFTYPGPMKIKDGKSDFNYKSGEVLVTGWLSLSGEYYINLDAGAQKEAIILLKVTAEAPATAVNTLLIFTKQSGVVPG